MVLGGFWIGLVLGGVNVVFGVFCCFVLRVELGCFEGVFVVLF